LAHAFSKSIGRVIQRCGYVDLPGWQEFLGHPDEDWGDPSYQLTNDSVRDTDTVYCV